MKIRENSFESKELRLARFHLSQLYCSQLPGFHLTWSSARLNWVLPVTSMTETTVSESRRERESYETKSNSNNRVQLSRQNKHRCFAQTFHLFKLFPAFSLPLSLSLSELALQEKHCNYTVIQQSGSDKHTLWRIK